MPTVLLTNWGQVEDEDTENVVPNPDGNDVSPTRLLGVYPFRGWGEGGAVMDKFTFLRSLLFLFL